jgi:hypothetical protein
LQRLRENGKSLKRIKNMLTNKIMGYHKIGVASVESIMNVILEILGDLKRENEEKVKTMKDETESFDDRDKLVLTSAPICLNPDFSMYLELQTLVCVCTCVNCNRSYEPKPRTKNERTRKVLCVQCQHSYEGI